MELESYLEPEDLQERVDRGAALLDQRNPKWFLQFTDDVMVDFNMADMRSDVLGVLYGDYDSAVVHLALKTTTSHVLSPEYGFDLSAEEAATVNGWPLLTALWESAIIERREAETEININFGSHNVHVLTATYQDIVNAFGSGLEASRDNYKQMAQWNIDTSLGHVEIYDYKVGTCYLGNEGLELEQITEWHVQGASREAIDEMMLTLREANE